MIIEAAEKNKVYDLMIALANGDRIPSGLAVCTDGLVYAHVSLMGKTLVVNWLSQPQPLPAPAPVQETPEPVSDEPENEEAPETPAEETAPVEGESA